MPSVAGEKYYLEGLMKEGGGGDSLDVGWAGPGIGDVPAALQASTAPRSPHPGAHTSWLGSPKPADGATDVMGPTFEWTAGINAVQHSIYFGTSPDLILAADLKNTWGGLPCTTTWARSSPAPPTTGESMRPTPRASFRGRRLELYRDPPEAHTPIPADARTGRDAGMKWAAGQTARGHDGVLQRTRLRSRPGPPRSAATM